MAMEQDLVHRDGDVIISESQTRAEEGPKQSMLHQQLWRVTGSIDLVHGKHSASQKTEDLLHCSSSIIV